MTGVRDLGLPQGNPLATPRSGGDITPKDRTIVDIITPGAGTYTSPTGYNFCRVIAVGAGGAGDLYGGGGGGGCAATEADYIGGSAISISYTIGDGAADKSQVPGGNTTCLALGRTLVANGGDSAVGNTLGVGGTASGGDFNFTGGNGGDGAGGNAGGAGGGGAAGPDGNGGNGAGGSLQNGGDGTKSGGGGGATGSATNYRSGSGGGPGGRGGVALNGSNFEIKLGGAPSDVTQFPSTYDAIVPTRTSTGITPPGAGGAGGDGKPLGGGPGLVRIELW